MKTPAPKSARRLARNRRGAALIIVLAVLVLIAALVVAFLGRTGVERTASASYDASSRARMLSDTAVNLVQAAINEASSTNGTTMWASQPGAVRVFDDTGKLQTVYRLYSAKELSTDTTDGSVLAADLPPTKWADTPAEWVDLNAPVLAPNANGTGTVAVFPILDPRDPNNPGSPTAPNVMTAMDGFSLGKNAPVPGNTTAQPVPMPVRWLYVLDDGTIVPGTGGNGKQVNVSGASRTNPIVGRIAYWTDDDTAKVNINTAAGSQTELNGEIVGAAWDVPRFTMRDDFKLFSQNQPVHGEYQRYPGHPATTTLYGVFTGLGIPMAGFPYSMPTFATGVNSGQPQQTTELYALLSRFDDASSSRGGTANTTRFSSTADIPKVSPPTRRLYSSVGELIYGADRTAHTGVARQKVESGKFFLTAQSRAPEVNLFGTPRVAMWPISAIISGSTGAPPLSEFDKLIAFCTSTTGPDVGGKKTLNRYFIQRIDSTSPTVDAEIPRNIEIYDYLRNLTSRDIPGFGGNFAAKYSANKNNANERDQILTEMVDYIRSTNLYDHSIQDPATGNPKNRYTPTNGNPGTAGNQVVPLKIRNTRGLGRMYTISEIGLHVIATADGNAPALPHWQTGVSMTGYQAPQNIDGKAVSPMKGSLNTPSYVSNLPAPQYLRNHAGDVYGWNATSRTIVKDGGDPFPANVTLGDNIGDALVALNPGEKRLQAIILLEVFSPMMGNDWMMPNWRVRATGLDNIGIGEPGMPQVDRYPFPSGSQVTGTMGTRFGHISQLGGLNGFQYLMSHVPWSGGNTRKNGWSTPDANEGSLIPYRMVSRPFTVPTEADGTGTLQISGNDLATLEVQTRKGRTGSVYETVQTFDVKFPNVSIRIPSLIRMGTSGTSALDWWGFDNRFTWALSAPGANTNGTNPTQDKGAQFRTDLAPVAGEVWDPSKTASIRINYYKNQSGTEGDANLPSDVVRSVVAKEGDVRLVMAKDRVTADGLPSSDMPASAGYFSNHRMAHSFMLGTGSNHLAGADLAGKLTPLVNYSPSIAPKVPSNASVLPSWDWDSGLPGIRDGAYANKPDEGNIYTNGTAISSNPYWNVEQSGDWKRFDSYFTANRIIPSPVMFGSLPTGVIEGIPWRTLLFRPATDRPRDPAGPKDHLLLDLFSMPVVEPYAISEPFSTAGKINMNYEIAPFSYIKRETGVRAVLSSELIARVHKRAGESRSSTSHSTYYRDKDATPSFALPDGAPTMARLPVDLNETLKQFEERFSGGDIFRSAAEICDIYLVPKGYTMPDFKTQWYGDDFALVGDNVRERPYANIYPRLTTKSNSFTVHYKVQALKSPPTMPDGKWDDKIGVVVGEYRGSTSLERFLDPNNKSIPDYAAQPTAPSLDSYYQWRVVANDTFAP